MQDISASQAKAEVLKTLSQWQLFGSSFFAVRRDNDPLEGSEHILALNMHGVHFLDLITHETILHYPFTEVISTRQVRPASHLSTHRIMAYVWSIQHIMAPLWSINLSYSPLIWKSS